MGKKGKDKLDKHVESVVNRSAAIETIFEIFEENKKKFKEVMKAECEKDPEYFYRKFVQPLQPKEIEFDAKNSKMVVGFKFTEVTADNREKKAKEEDDE